MDQRWWRQAQKAKAKSALLMFLSGRSDATLCEKSKGSEWDIKKTFGSETFGIDFASFHDCHNKDARAKARRNFCGAPSWGGEKGALSEGQRLYQV